MPSEPVIPTGSNAKHKLLQKIFFLGGGGRGGELFRLNRLLFSLTGMACMLLCMTCWVAQD